MKQFRDAFPSLFEVNMGVRGGERIVVFGDTIRADEHLSPNDADRRQRLLAVAREAAAFADSAYGNTIFIGYPATSASGVEPPVELWKAVMGEKNVAMLQAEGLLDRLLLKTADSSDLEKAREIVVGGSAGVADVVVAMANNSTSHTRFRALANAAGCRYASLPHFDPEMFYGSMQVDWKALAARTARLAEMLRGAETVLLSTPNGTRMVFGCSGRCAEGDDGLLTDAGSFGNLPAGEVYLAPLEGTSKGELVLEYAPTRKLAGPVRLVVKDGNVVDVIGDEPHAGRLRKAFEENPLTRNIAELGIGTNDRASCPDNILEAEKILGTVHVALGDNSGFGGRVQVPFHEDYIFYHPTLKAIMADGSERLLLDNGRLLV
jgi:leucyl aminopeptidase (aminopeptidase T)